MVKAGNRAAIRILIAAYIASMMLQAMTCMSLMLHGLGEVYPNASAQQLQFILTTMNIFAIFGMLLAGKFATYFTKKTILVVLMFMMGIGGLIGYFSVNLAMVYIAAAIIGMADASFTPMTAALIAEYLEGEKRAIALGLQGFFVNIGGVILNLVGGFLAAVLWKNLYFMYIAAFPIGLLLVFLLPSGGCKEVAAPTEKAPVFTKFQFSFMFTAFINGLVFMSLMANVVMLVFDLGMGNEVQAGFITSGANVACVVVALVIVPLMKWLKQYHWAVSLALATVGCWILSFASSLPIAIIGGVFIGACYSMHNTAYFSIAPANVHPAKVSMSMSLVSVSINLGMIMCPVIITPLALLFGDAVSLRFMVTAVIATIATIIAFILPRTTLKDSQLTIRKEEK